MVRKHLDSELDKIKEWVVDNIPIPVNEVEVTDDCIADLVQENQHNREKTPREKIFKENNYIDNQEIESIKDKKEKNTYKIQQKKTVTSILFATKKKPNSLKMTPKQKILT